MIQTLNTEAGTVAVVYCDIGSHKVNNITCQEIPKGLGVSKSFQISCRLSTYVCCTKRQPKTRLNLTDT